MKLSSIACASIAALAVCALGADGSFAAAKVKSHSNTNNNRSATENVYFQNLSPNEQDALKRLCDEHNGQVVTNDDGQVGCQVGSLKDSKNISDGAAKGQATE